MRREFSSFSGEGMAFSVKLCTSSGVKLLRWLSDDTRPWLLLWNFAPVLVWNFCGDCLTTYDHGFFCGTLHQFWCETFAVIVWPYTTMADWHSWHVITFSLLLLAKEINWLCILGMRLPPHRQHRYISRKGLIDCAFLVCDYLLIVTFRREKD